MKVFGGWLFFLVFMKIQKISFKVTRYYTYKLFYIKAQVSYWSGGRCEGNVMEVLNVCYVAVLLKV